MGGGTLQIKGNNNFLLQLVLNHLGGGTLQIKGDNNSSNCF
jgi:hypothetical protein